jgi:cold shock CspA family protein
MAETWNKREREKKKQQLKREKQEKKLERKDQARNGNDLDSMMAYIDENGDLSSTPADPRKKPKLSIEDIVIGVPKQEPVDPADLIRTGTVTLFFDGKGYGFIRDEESRQSIFVHVNELMEAVSVNDKVNFEMAKGPKGPLATKVRLAK